MRDAALIGQHRDGSLSIGSWRATRTWLRFAGAALVLLSATVLVSVVDADVHPDRRASSMPALVAPARAPALETRALAGISPPEAAIVDRDTAAATPTPRAPRGEVPILYYHRIQSPPAGFWSWSQARRNHQIAYEVLPSAFAAQLDWLSGHGYTTILPRDLAAHWDLGAPLPARPVILTFDDGTPDWTRTVLPLLRRHGMVAEFYLTLDAIRNHSITWPEVRALASAGNGIGAHDVHHVQLANLGRGRPDASTTTMRAEVTDIRAVIEAHVGVPPDSMAYVGGGFNDTLMNLVRQAGYSSARATVSGRRQSVANRYALRVVHVGWQDDVANERLGTIVPGLPTFARRLGQPSSHADATPAPGLNRTGVSGSESPS